MLCGLSLVLLAWATLSARTASQPCLCSALVPAGLRVNCSSLDLAHLPARLPRDTAELHARDNRLTSVSPGLFDGLAGLNQVSLSGNPFHCDCEIQYLRNWLLSNRAAVVSGEPTCASPTSVAQRAVVDLSEDYFSSCARASCADGTYDAVLAATLCGLALLLLWSFRLAKTSSITLSICERHAGLEADSLRSLRPRHRRRLLLHTAQYDVSADSVTFTDDVETPRVDMELLPQVLDALNKKHNIKLKAT